MKKVRKYNWWQIIPASLMLLMLLWLSIATPFLYAAAQSGGFGQHQSCDCEDETDPISGTNEEKDGSSINTVSEFLHHASITEHLFMDLPRVYKCHPCDLYFAFHPELNSPPPEPA